MNLEYLINTVIGTDLSDLPFVDRYAGMTTKLVRKESTPTGSKEVSYPISCCVSERDCNDNALYSDLVFDDSKKSVVYWESVTPMTYKGQTPNLNNFNNQRWSGRARLIVWLNLKELGFKFGGVDGSYNCAARAYALPQIMKAISSDKRLLDGMYEGNRVVVKPVGFVTDHEELTRKYSYNKYKNYFLYPYSLIAIDVDFQIDICLGNSYNFPIQPAIDCVDYTCPEGTELPTDEQVLFLWANTITGATTGDLLGNWVGGGTTPVTYTQTDSSRQPTYLLDGKDNTPSVNFDTASYLEHNTALFTGGEASIFAVFARNGSPHGGSYGSALVMSAISFVTIGPKFIQVNDLSNKLSLNSINAAFRADFATNTTDLVYIGVVKTSTGANYYYNGILVATITGVLDLNNSYSSIGAWSNNYWNGEMKAIIAYNKAVNSTERVEIDTWAKENYPTLPIA